MDVQAHHISYAIDRKPRVEVTHTQHHLTSIFKQCGFNPGSLTAIIWECMINLRCQRLVVNIVKQVVHGDIEPTSMIVVSDACQKKFNQLVFTAPVTTRPDDSDEEENVLEHKRSDYLLRASVKILVTRAGMLPDEAFPPIPEDVDPLPICERRFTSQEYKGFILALREYLHAKQATFASQKIGDFAPANPFENACWHFLDHLQENDPDLPKQQLRLFHEKLYSRLRTALCSDSREFTSETSGHYRTMLKDFIHWMFTRNLRTPDWKAFLKPLMPPDFSQFDLDHLEADFEKLRQWFEAKREFSGSTFATSIFKEGDMSCYIGDIQIDDLTCHLVRTAALVQPGNKTFSLVNEFEHFVMTSDHPIVYFNGMNTAEEAAKREGLHLAERQPHLSKLHVFTETIKLRFPQSQFEDAECFIEYLIDKQLTVSNDHKVLSSNFRINYNYLGQYIASLVARIHTHIFKSKKTLSEEERILFHLYACLEFMNYKVKFIRPRTIFFGCHGGVDRSTMMYTLWCGYNLLKKNQLTPERMEDLAVNFLTPALLLSNRPPHTTEYVGRYLAAFKKFGTLPDEA